MSPITADTPKVINKSYANWWVDRVSIWTVNPSTQGQTSAISATFVRGNKLENGQWELSPLLEDSRTMSITDIFAFAAEQYALGNTEIAALLENFINTIAAIAKSQNCID